MDADETTAAVQRSLDALGAVGGESPAGPVVRDLLARSVDPLRLRCTTLLHRSYARLTRPPLNLQADEMLSAVMERLLRAMRAVRPHSVRQFFALANQHMRWELNGLARRLDRRSRTVELREDFVSAESSSETGVSPVARRMLEAVENLPEHEREAFDLVRLQGLTQPEAAELAGVSAKTVHRRLQRGLLLLTAQLDDLRPAGVGAASP